MGRKHDYKHLSLSQHRVSFKKGWMKRRKRLKELARLNEKQAEIVGNVTNRLFVKSVADINSKVETGMLHCFNQVMIKEAHKEPVETYKKESIHNENIEFCKSENNLCIDNQEFLEEEEEKIEIYEEEIEIYEEEGEKEEGGGEEEKNTYNENVESVVETCIEENIYNGNIEYCEDLKDLIIDNNDLSDRINNIPKNIPEGRYIVDIFYMWNEIHRTFNDHARGIECQFKYWELVNFRRRGLLTQLFFKCKKCNYETSIFTEPINSSEKSDINAAAAAGCVEVGIGYTQMRKLCTAMNIKYMSEKTYTNNRDNLVKKKTGLENIRKVS
ncbi:uncharacterized protein [Anoplolepis gracilipes]|uniref:uncharacterized protein isoform X2 n=1 Tax=Anoplolepis gracilipes TaxID=354296 RepID=UPI003BA031F1